MFRLAGVDDSILRAQGRENEIVLGGDTVFLCGAQEVAPTPPCVRVASRELGAGRSLEWVVTPMSVDGGRVFLVVDDADAAETTARARELERVE